MNEKVHDVAIIGGGIGGSITAAILARNGVDVLLAEGTPHPRFTIGESTTPETSLSLRLLATRYGVPELGNLSTYSNVQKIAPTSGVKRNFCYVGHHIGERARPHECAQFPTFPQPLGPDMHYFRQDIDAYLFQVAVKYGATAKNGTLIEDVEFHDDLVQLRAADGSTFLARYVVDAGGRNALIPTKLGLRDAEPRFQTKTRTIFTHMLGVLPWEAVGPKKEDHGMPSPFSEGTLHHFFKGGWIWIIPFNNHPQSVNPLCSIGINLDIDSYPIHPGISAEQEFWGIIKNYPSIADQLRQARAVRPFVSTGRTQFSSKKIVGTRFCLLPHAAEFVDPLYSTGMAITVNCINALAHRLIEAARSGDYNTERFRYIEEWTKKSFDVADDTIWCTYESFSDFRLFNAVLKMFAIQQFYTTTSPLETWARYLRTGNREVFSRMEEHPRRGAQCADFPEIREMVTSITKEISTYKFGDQDCADLTSAIYRHIATCSDLVPPFLKILDPDSRLPIGRVTIPQIFRFLFWFNFQAPNHVRKQHVTMQAMPLIIKEVVQSWGHQVQQAGNAIWPHLRDYVATWNRDWKRSM
ncbi:MAG: tryptophan 7-halogenase [Pseudonocardiales bacterium]|nr:tryptophan 7-halogenase [Pseudonocardiales bacterium]